VRSATDLLWGLQDYRCLSLNDLSRPMRVGLYPMQQKRLGYGLWARNYTLYSLRFGAVTGAIGPIWVPPAHEYYIRRHNASGKNSANGLAVVELLLISSSRHTQEFFRCRHDVVNIRSINCSVIAPSSRVRDMSHSERSYTTHSELQLPQVAKKKQKINKNNNNEID